MRSYEFVDVDTGENKRNYKSFFVSFYRILERPEGKKETCLMESLQQIIQKYGRKINLTNIPQRKMMVMLWTVVFVDDINLPLDRMNHDDVMHGWKPENEHVLTLLLPKKINNDLTLVPNSFFVR